MSGVWPEGTMWEHDDLLLEWEDAWTDYADRLLDRRDRHLPLPAVSKQAKVVDLFARAGVAQDEAA